VVAGGFGCREGDLLCTVHIPNIFASLSDTMHAVAYKAAKESSLSESGLGQAPLMKIRVELSS
jgi:hypothetical protein